MNQVSDKITGVILAGGKANRMHGRDKGLLSLAGRPMIEYVIEVIRPQVDDLLINANRSKDMYSKYGLRVVQDKKRDFSGPLAGIASGIEAATTDLVLTVPCDCPWIPKDLATRLKKRLCEGLSMVAVAHDGQRMQSVFALFRREVLKEIYSYLDAGDRKLQLWIERQQPALVDFSDNPDAFININTPEERLRIEQIIAGR